MKNLLQHPVYRFLFVFALLFIGWFLLYNLWLHPKETLDVFVIDLTISFSKFLLELFGYTVFTEGRAISLPGASGLYVGDSCNAISLFALFSGFVIAYPGSIKRKLIYIPSGIISIFILNCLRIFALSIINAYSYEWTEFNHTYTFNVIVYGYIFLLWYLWVEKFSGGKKIFSASNE